MTALVADLGTRAFWLGSVCTFVYFVVLGVLVGLWWLFRDADKPTPGEKPLTRVEREFLEIVKGARR